MIIPPIDPEILEHSRQMVEAKKKREKKQYLKDHCFDIINSGIALIALIIAILGLFFPKG